MIDLTTIPLGPCEPQIQDFGGVLTPPLGGPVQRINRVGTRWAVSFETPSLPADPDLRLWSGRIARAKIEGALIWVPEPDSTYDGALLGGIQSYGPNYLLLTGLVPGQTLAEGKWLSVVSDGRRYLHRLTTTTGADLDGRSGVGIFPALRTVPATGAFTELREPKMQGSLSIGSLPIPLYGSAPLSFSIAEDE